MNFKNSQFQISELSRRIQCDAFELPITPSLCHITQPLSTAAKHLPITHHLTQLLTSIISNTPTHNNSSNDEMDCGAELPLPATHSTSDHQQSTCHRSSPSHITAKQRLQHRTHSNDGQSTAHSGTKWNLNTARPPTSQPHHITLHQQSPLENTTQPVLLLSSLLLTPHKLLVATDACSP
jgi:hypothetical protein